MLPIVGSLLVAMAPHVVRLPPWIVAWCLGAWGYVGLSMRYRLPQPGRLLLAGLAVAGGLAVVTGGSKLFDQSSGLNLLALMCGLKPFEIRTERDRMVSLFLAYFLVVTSLFFDDSLVMTLYMALSVLVTTSVLIYVNHPGGRFKAHVKLAGWIMAQAIPLMAVLFMVFPRVQGSLWTVAQPAVAKTGFSDNLTPGSVLHLVRSDEIAFRANFKTGIPAPGHLYWRGVVFTRFDGTSWHRGHPVRYHGRPVTGKSMVTYSITLEPDQQHWLFALDLPAATTARAHLLSDFTLYAQSPVKQRLFYDVSSVMTYRTAAFSPEKPVEDLQLPKEGNPRSRKLARQWAAGAPSAEAVVARGLAYLKNGGFVYTLNPPPLGSNSIDDFLFRTRKGYCEHFASAFAFLMRAAGVPARVVGGYLGGERNPFGNYLIVRQTYAHAWVEVWYAKRGWVRVDPTAQVAPDRVTGGPAAALPAADALQLQTLPNLGPFTALLKTLGLGWDSINNYWDQWVLDYSYRHQQDLLRRLGLAAGSWKSTLLAMSAAIGLAGFMALMLIIRPMRRPREPAEPVQKLYLAFCRKLARVGVARRPGEGPVDFAARVAHSRPELKDPVGEITSRYVRLRYGTGGGRLDVKHLAALVRRFNPRKR